MRYEATRMNNGKWAVRPEGQLGTCGFYPVPWTVQYINAHNAAAAIARASIDARVTAFTPADAGHPDNVIL